MECHYFIGIPMPSSISEQAERFQTKYQLQTHYKVIPHMADLHITLLYIGAMTNTQRESLQSNLQTIANHHALFSLQIDGLSYFGSETGPRVVYLNVQNVPALTALQKAIAKDATALLDMPMSDRFTPHVTIAKKRKPTKGPIIKKEIIEPIDMPVPSFSLFAVHPKKSPKYEEVTIFKLQH